MKISLVVALAVGLGGCDAQQLQTGEHPLRDGGVTDLAVRSADAGCPLDARVSCGPHNCDYDVVFGPICSHGVWTCPADPVYTSDICIDAGPDFNPGDSCQVRQDGSIVACVSACSGDAALEPVCLDAVWICPQGTFDVSTCPNHSG